MRVHMGGFSTGARSGKSSLGQVSGTGTACRKLKGAGIEGVASGCPSGWKMVASGPETGGDGAKLFPGGTAHGVSKNAGGTSIGAASGADGTGADPGTGPASGALAGEKALDRTFSEAPPYSGMGGWLIGHQKGRGKKASGRYVVEGGR